MSAGSRTPAADGLRILLVTPNVDNNSLGRAYCLWLLCQHLGWSAPVVAVKGLRLWAPLSDGAFAEDCTVLTGLPPTAQRAELRALVAASDVVIAVKPLSSSLGTAAPLAEELGRLLLVDVDDPDLEVRASARPLLRRQRPRTTWGRRREVAGLRRLTEARPTLVSNPVLQQTYGGLVVPHVRPAAPAPTWVPPRPSSDDDVLVVRFVGSPRGHKGVDELRTAVGRLARQGVRLEITADAPPDARPWERWLGSTTFARGQELVASADVVALPSLAEGYAPAQLPAKLVDAMVHGRAVVASDLPPVAWALGGSGLLVPPGDVDALTAAVERLTDPGLRRRLGTAAHTRAMRHFTVEAVAPAFADHVGHLLARHRASSRGTSPRTAGSPS